MLDGSSYLRASSPWQSLHDVMCRRPTQLGMCTAAPVIVPAFVVLKACATVQTLPLCVLTWG